MFLIHNALGEDVKIFDPDEEPTASRLFNKINTNPEEEEDLNIVTIVRNEFNKIKEDHPEVIERIKQLPNRTKTAKQYKENNTVVFRKKGLALFSFVVNYDDGKIKPYEKNFQELLDSVKCSFDEKRLPLSKQFWKSYEKIKEYKPQYKSGRSELSLETKANNSLKFLLKEEKEKLNQEDRAFIETLLKDIKHYKTLSISTLRRLVLPEKKTEEPYAELIQNIENLRKRIGSDYLDKVIKRAPNIEDEIIIAVENRKKAE